MSWWNFSKKNKKTLVAIIDIGSAEVSGALISISIDKNNKRHFRIIFNTRVETGVEEVFDFYRFDSGVCRGLKKVVDNLLKSGLGIPERYFCFLSSPFVFSQTKIINYSQADSFTFTQKTLDNLSRRESDAFCAKYSQDGPFSLIDNKIMQVKLDGYETTSLFGNKIKSLAISQFLSGGSSHQLEKIKQVIIGSSHNDNIVFHSYSFAIFSSLRDILNMKKNFLAIDIGGELTDIFLSLDGVMVENISFPYGTNSMLRDIALKQNILFSEAKTQLGLLINNKLHSRTRENIEKNISEIKNKWLGSFSESLSLILSDSFLPEQIILTGDSQASPLFVSWLKETDFHKYKPTDKPFHIAYFDYTKISDIISGTRNINDTYLILEALFLQKIYSDPITKIK